MSWRDILRDLFAAPPVSGRSASLRSSRFDLSVCPGCRGLRLMASQRCEHCDSTAGVTATPDCAYRSAALRRPSL